jgi:hypothetical protein
LAAHQRIEWNLRPVCTVHEVLVRRGLWTAAARWEKLILEQTESIAEDHLRRFDELCETYGMALATIGDHLAEQFQGPFVINRLKALLRLAWEAVQAQKGSADLDLLKSELRTLAERPSGVGWEPPDWLQALYEELQHLQTPHHQALEAFELPLPIPQVQISYESLHAQLRRWV